jgi:hypothetical protein
MTSRPSRAALKPISIVAGLSLVAVIGSCLSCLSEGDEKAGVDVTGSNGSTGPTGPTAPGQQPSTNPGAGGGHAWCRKNPEKSSIVGVANAVWGSSSSDIWYAVNDVSVGSYPGSNNPSDPSVILIEHGYPKIAHWDGQTVCKTTLATIFPTKGDKRQGLSPYAVWGSSATDVWMGGEGGLLLHWDGHSWEAAPSFTQANISAILGTAADNIYALARGLLWHYNGVDWALNELPSELPGIKEMWIDEDERVWGMFDVQNGDCDVVLVDPNQAEVECRLVLRKYFSFYRLRHIGGFGREPWLIMRDGAQTNVVLQLVNGVGDLWDIHRLPANNDLYSVHGFASDDIWVGGEGRFWHWDGSSFTRQPGTGFKSETTSWIWDIQGTSSHDMWGRRGGVLGAEGGWIGDGSTFRAL